MRTTIIGAGSVARRHVEVLTVLGAEIGGIVDPDRTVAERLAADCGTRAYGSVDHALDAERPGAVYICVPPFAHGEPERAAIARGLPFFVEKPVGLDPALAEGVARMVEKAGLVTGTGYHWRCLDTVERAREHLLERPALGATGSWLGKRPPVSWWARQELSGGQVVEQLTHLLDLGRVLLGEATEVYAAGAQLEPKPGDVDDITAATVRFASGAVATFTATSLLNALHSAHLRTCSPGLMTELTEATLVLDDGATRKTFKPVEDPRVVVDREFLEAVRGERASTRAPYAEALRTHRLGWAITESARLQQPVRILEPSG